MDFDSWYITMWYTDCLYSIGTLRIVNINRFLNDRIKKHVESLLIRSWMCEWKPFALMVCLYSFIRSFCQWKAIFLVTFFFLSFKIFFYISMDYVADFGMVRLLEPILHLLSFWAKCSLKIVQPMTLIFTVWPLPFFIL